jgi:hypothetical protein
MKIVLSLCFVALAMLFHPSPLKNESGAAFRTINISQTENGYQYFGPMVITSGPHFSTFLEELSHQTYWNNRQAFVDALLNAKIDFNQEALVLLPHTQASGSQRITFETPVLQDKTLLCEIRDELLGVGPAIVTYHSFALAVSKSLVNKVQFNVVGGFDQRSRSTIVLSTIEQQPLNMRRDPPPLPKPSPGDCPKLIIGCPTDLLETGKTYTVKLVVEGGNLKPDVSYNWSVTGGEIVGGQGTLGLVVRINKPNEILKAWVSLGGVNPYCDAVTNCSCGPSR